MLARADVRLTMAQLLRDGRDPRIAVLEGIQTVDAYFRVGRQRLLDGEDLDADEVDRLLGHIGRLAALTKLATDIGAGLASERYFADLAERTLPLVLGAIDRAVDGIPGLDPVARRELLADVRRRMLAEFAGPDLDQPSDVVDAEVVAEPVAVAETAEGDSGDPAEQERVDALRAEAEAESAEDEALEREATELRAELARLRAMRTGRRT